MSELHQRLAKIQAELKAPKGRYNSFAKFHYRSAEDILEAVKPLLGEISLTLSDRMECIGDRFYLVATAQLTLGEHAIQAQGVAREASEKKGMDSAQLSGATSSYARKYALNGLFAIDDADDSDAPRTTQKKESAAEVQSITDDQIEQLEGLVKTLKLTPEKVRDGALWASGPRNCQSVADLTHEEGVKLIKFMEAKVK